MSNSQPAPVRRLKIAFSDFIFSDHFTDKLSGLNPRDNFFTQALGAHYTIECGSLDEADVLIYSTWGNDHRKFRGKKIFYTSENVLPDFNECDFAITFCHLPDESRHLRLPQYINYIPEPEILIKKPDVDARTILKQKNRFCNFVVSNPRGAERNKFFRQLNRRQSVDSGGRHFNNLGKVVTNKLEFLKDYKFTLAFENSSSPGYTTEKLVEPMLAQSLPIYWGNPEVARDFNPRSFINISDFPNFEAAIDYVLEVDRNAELYLSYLREPWFHNNEIPDLFKANYLSEALKRFVQEPWVNRPRVYTNRGLRDHALGTGLKRHLSSFSCKLDGLLWKAGWRK